MSLKLRASGVSSDIDADEVRRALLVLVDPEQGVELRGLPTGTSYVHRGNDLDGLCRSAGLLGHSTGVYYCLNPIPTNARRALAENVLRRRLLLIDIDPDNPTDTSATEAEKEAARLLAFGVMEWLSVLGFPAPVLIDSGNGWHLLYRIDLPNDAHAQAIIKALLYALAKRFDDGKAHVDISVHNASRIAKLPGTWARKGPLDPERPYRMARLLSAPSVPTVVTAEQISAATAAAVVVVETPPVNGTADHGDDHSAFLLTATVGDESGRAYARAALEKEVARVALASPGGRNNALNRAAFSLGQLVAGGCILRQAVESALEEAARGVGLAEAETAKTIRSGLDAGGKKPRKAPERKEKPRASASETIPDGQSVLLWASAVEPRHVEWLWPGRIPLGKMTTFAGQTTLGKTFVCMDMAARVTTGADWPDCPGEVQEAGRVLVISGEDDPDDTLVPRLIECGADLKKVAFLRYEIQDNFSLADIKTLERAVAEMDGVRLIIIDPPSSFMGDVNDHKNAEVRGLLSPLKSFASRRKLALVFITHFSKSGGMKVEAIQRVMGTVAWVNAVRAAHAFVRDPEGSDRRLMLPLKMNLCKEPKGLGFRIVSSGLLAKVEWLGEVDLTADQAISGEKGKTRKVVASEWLVERFRERLEWDSNDLFKAGKEAGVSRNAIFEAKTILDLPPARRRHAENGDQFYVWWVPSDWPPLTADLPSQVPKKRDTGTPEDIFEATPLPD